MSISVCREWPLSAYPFSVPEPVSQTDFQGGSAIGIPDRQMVGASGSPG